MPNYLTNLTATGISWQQRQT